MTRTNPLRLGRKTVDLFDPRAEDIDLPAVRARLRRIRRFNQDPNALTVRQHGILTRLIFERRAANPSLAIQHEDFIADWCEHHDDHEAVIGDIVGPVKRQLTMLDGGHTLRELEHGLDVAIHDASLAAGEGYLVPWLAGNSDTEAYIYETVETFDRMAETFEWLHVLHNTIQPWNVRLPEEITSSVHFLLHQTYQKDLD